MDKVYFNRNWIFIKNKKNIFLYNFVSSKELLIDKYIEPSIYLLKSFSSTDYGHIQEIFKDFKNKFQNLDKKWFTDSLKQLRKRGIIKDIKKKPRDLTQQYLLGLDRQIDYLEDLFPNKNKYQIQKGLKDTKIAILGLGSVAQSIIQCLVASGIGNYVCVDFDVVEERNIGRQPIFRKTDIGKTKANAIKKYIEESRYGNKVKVFNKMIKSPKDVEQMIIDCDVVLQCCDYPRFVVHRWINNACLKLKKPNLLVHAGRIGPLSIPYKSSCYGCLEKFYEKHFIAYKDIKKIIISEGFGRYPTLSIIPSITGVIAAKEVIAFLLGMSHDSHNAFLDIEPYTLQTTKHILKRQKNCHACGRNKK